MGNYNHAMNDNETLATEPDAVVLSIGLQLFDPAFGIGWPAMGAGFYVVLSRDEQHSRRSDPKTIAWWAEQSPDARRLFEDEQTRVRPALLEMNDFIERHMGPRAERMLWGNGAAFDNVVLKDLYRWAGVPFPFKYHNDRCYRTLKALMPEDTLYGRPRAGVHHNAADDARFQAEDAVHMLRRLESAKGLADAAGVLSGQEDEFSCINEGPERDAVVEAWLRYDQGRA